MSLNTKEFSEKTPQVEVEDGLVESPSYQVPEDFIDFTPEEERSLVRRLDMTLLPLMGLVMFCQYLDKQSISYAAVFSLQADLGMNANQFSWCTSGFYIGQLVSQIVYTFLLSKFPVKMVTGICVVLWAITCGCLAAPNSTNAFILVRSILGFLEGAVSPAFIIIMSLYYKKSEHSLRAATYISCNAVAQIVDAYLFYGIGRGENNIALAVWRLGFIVCGCLTLVSGVMFLVLIPMSPANAWFFTERQKEIAVHRMLAEEERGERGAWDWAQAKEVLTDWVSWSSFMFGFLATLVAGPIVFSSIMINKFGYDKFKTLEYGSPTGAVQLIAIWVSVGLLRMMPKQRCLVLCIMVMVPVAGHIILLVLRKESGWAVIVGSWLASCITCYIYIMLALNASNVRGNTKKAIVSNLFYLGYCLAAIIFPQWWDYDKDPTYTAGLAVGVGSYALMIVWALGYRYMCIKENKRRDDLQAQGLLPPYEPGLDLTDKQDLYHRYSY